MVNDGKYKTKKSVLTMEGGKKSRYSYGKKIKSIEQEFIRKKKTTITDDKKFLRIREFIRKCCLEKKNKPDKHVERDSCVRLAH